MLTGAALLGTTGVTLGGGIPAAMSSRGWMMSLLKTAFFCHRFSTRTILLCLKKERDRQGEKRRPKNGPYNLTIHSITQARRGDKGSAQLAARPLWLIYI